MVGLGGRIPPGREHRVFCITRFEEGVFVLHAFEKRSRKAPTREIEVARARLQDVLAARRRGR